LKQHLLAVELQVELKLVVAVELVEF